MKKLQLPREPGAAPVNQTSADGNMTGQYDQHYAPSCLLMSIFLVLSATSQSTNYPIVLRKQDGSRPEPNPHLKLWNFRESNPQPHGKQSDTLMRRSDLPMPLLIAEWNLSQPGKFSNVKANFSSRVDDQWANTSLS